MPLVNVKYNLKKAALIDTISELKFQNKSADIAEDTQSPTEVKGKVKEIQVADQVQVILECHGPGKDLEWELTVEIVELEDSGLKDENGKTIYDEMGSYDIDPKPIEGKTRNNGLSVHDEFHDIKWT